MSVSTNMGVIDDALPLFQDMGPAHLKDNLGSVLLDLGTIDEEGNFKPELIFVSEPVVDQARRAIAQPGFPLITHYRIHKEEENAA